MGTNLKQQRTTATKTRPTTQMIEAWQKKTLPDNLKDIIVKWLGS